MSSKYRNTPKGRIAPNGYRLCEPLPEGQVMIDATKKEWVIGKPIGLGGFGEIYLCHSKKEPREECVMKLDNSSGPLFVEINLVSRFCNKYKELVDYMKRKNIDFLGMPQFKGWGTMKLPQGDYRFLVMERLGEELQTVLETKRLSINHTCKIACRIIDVLEFLHGRGFIHADIKAQNILRARNIIENGEKSKKRPLDGEDDKYYLIDYGLADRFLFQKEHKPYEPDKRKANNGTVEFRSRDAHIGVISRRSDIESLGYNLIVWFYGRHPWANMLKNADLVLEKKSWAMENIPEFLDEAFSDKPLDCISSSGSKASKSIVKSKKSIPVATRAPKGLDKFFKEVSKMSHDTEPDYEKFKSLLREIGSLNKDEKNLNLSCKKNRFSNEITSANDKSSKLIKKEDIVVEKKGRRGRACLQASQKPIKLTRAKNGCNGKQDLSENDETEIEDHSIDQDIVKPRKRGRPKKSIENKLELLKAGVRVKKALITKGVKKPINENLALKTQNRVLNRTRSKTDLDSSDEFIKEELSNKRKSPKSVTPLPVPPRKYPRLSTPLIMASPSGSDDSPLFGPYELEESVKENRVVIPLRRRNLTSTHLDSDKDEPVPTLLVPSCRVYINDKRCSPVDEDLPANDHLPSTSSVSSHHSSSTECYTPSSSSHKKLLNGKCKVNDKINGHVSNSTTSSNSRSRRNVSQKLLNLKDDIYTVTPKRNSQIDTPVMRAIRRKIEKKSCVSGVQVKK